MDRPQTEDERRARQSAEGMSSRIAQAHALKGQLRRLEADEQALAQELKDSAAEAQTRQQQRAQEQRCGKLEARRLRLLERDDEWVRATLSATRKSNGIMPADSATEADELLWLLVDKPQAGRCIDGAEGASDLRRREDGQAG